MSSDLMIDSEEMNVFWEPWTSPAKTKRKKKSKKDKKLKNKTDGSAEKKKKKKSSKFKEPAERKKEKRKAKKKPALALGLDLEGESVVTVKRRCTENPETQDFKKETKRKKTVAFDLSPEHNHVKPPKYVFCSLQSPEESAGAVGTGENHPQVTAPDQNQNRSQPVNDDSQCPSDDVQSQDLFITQRTFRSPISQTSSSESSDKAGVSTPAQRRKHTSAVKTKSQDPCFDQRNATVKKNTLEALFSQEEDSAFFQTQKESNAKQAKYKPASRPLSAKPKAANPFLDAPTVADDAKTKKPSAVSSAFTQTENFFTTELSSYLGFCQKNRRSGGDSEDVKPLDLSLPNRVRRDRDGGSETSDIEMQDDQDGGFKSSQEPPLKDVGGRRGSKGQKTPSSESESRSAETTGSSEDIEAPCQTNRLDLMQFQVRAVQMRLNQSFYFRAKGEGYSPRPASPLMKLSQGRDLKSKKRN